MDFEQGPLLDTIQYVRRHEGRTLGNSPVIQRELKDYLLTHGAARGVRQLSDDESLLDAGVIDSTMMVDLILFLESNYGISVEEDEMTPEHFDSINSIAAYVQSKSAARS